MGRSDWRVRSSEPFKAKPKPREESLKIGTRENTEDLFVFASPTCCLSYSSRSIVLHGLEVSSFKTKWKCTSSQVKYFFSRGDQLMGVVELYRLDDSKLFVVRWAVPCWWPEIGSFGRSKPFAVLLSRTLLAISRVFSCSNPPPISIGQFWYWTAPMLDQTQWAPNCVGGHPASTKILYVDCSSHPKLYLYPLSSPALHLRDYIYLYSRNPGENF